MTLIRLYFFVAYGDSANSTTHAAIADGSITIRDKDNQTQDISRLSNDTRNAANPLDKIFNAEEQMRNLEAINLAGQIVSQVTSIATNIGVMNAQDQARAEADANKDAASKDPAIIAKARENLKNSGNENPTQEDLNKATYAVIYQASYDKFYEKEMETYGTGSNVGRAIQAAGAALTVAMGGGSAGNAAAAASAPFLALEVKKLTEGPDTKDKVINAIAHAIVGGVVAQGSGNSAASGAIGAASGELIAQIIIKDLYDGKKPEQLTEVERQTVITLSMIAAGAVGGVVGDSTESTATAAGAGYNAAANNATAIIKEVIKFGGKACVSNALCRTELTKVSAELLIKAGVTAEVANQISNNMSEDQIDALSSLLTGDAIGATKYLSQIAAEYVMGVDGNKGWTTTLPIPEQDPNGGKLVNPITDQHGGTVLVNPDQSGQWGASNTGNQEGVPDVGGNTTVTPIPDGPSQDDLAYLSDNFQSGSGRGSAIPVPEPVEAINGLIYQSNGKHTPGQQGYNLNAGTEPRNSLELFANSIEYGKKRYALDVDGNVHQFTDTNNGSWHWSGSTGDETVPLKKREIPNDVRKAFGLPGKWR